MKPVQVKVPAPCDAFPPLRFTLYRRSDAENRIKVLLRDINAVLEADDARLHLLLAAAHWAEAIDYLLDGLLEVIRREQDRDVEQAWWGELPAWPQESEGVAAA